LKVSVDVGYGFTKAVSERGVISFPSVISPAVNFAADEFGKMFDYKVKIRNCSLNVEKFVGEAAEQSQGAARFSTREKPAELHDILLLTAVYLCTEGEKLSLAVGLPLAYYKAQKEDLKSRLKVLATWVSVNNGPERHIRFEDVSVFPQGVGAVAALDDLPDKGLVGLIDIGTYTTDYFLLNIRNRLPYPVPEACSSIEGGVQLIMNALAQEYHRQTGSPLPGRMQQTVLEKTRQGETVTFWNRQINLTKAYKLAIKDAVEAISSQVQSAFGDRLSMLDRTYLIGGGSILMFEELKERYPNVEMLPDPVFANARGYLKLIGQ